MQQTNHICKAKFTSLCCMYMIYFASHQITIVITKLIGSVQQICVPPCPRPRQVAMWPDTGTGRGDHGGNGEPW